MNDQEYNDQEDDILQPYTMLDDYIIYYWLYNLIGTIILAGLIFWAYTKGHSLLVAIIIGLCLDILLIYTSSLISWKLPFIITMPYLSVAHKFVTKNKVVESEV